jgi:hypothetical protein
VTGGLPHGVSGKQVAVPLHREVAVGTLAGILRRIGMTADEFRELLR